MIRFVLLSILAVVGGCSQSIAQTLLWSQRYDSGQFDTLGPGRPLFLEGSAFVTLAGRAGNDSLIARFSDDGALTGQRVQPIAPSLATVVDVIAEGEGALWAGSGISASNPLVAVVRLGLTGDPDWLFRYDHPCSTLDICADGLYRMAQGGDGSMFVAWSGTGRFCSTVLFIEKWGGWYVPAYSSCSSPHGVTTLAAEPTGGALVSGVLGGVPFLERVGAPGTVWTRGPGDPGWPWNEVPRLLAPGPDGSAYAGSNDASGGFATVRYSPGGAALWVRKAGSGSTDRLTQMATDVVGSVYVTGASEGGGGTNDYLTVKYGADGALLWSQRYDSGGSDEPAGLAVDGGGNAWVAGISGSDLLTVRYDPGGAPVFAHRFALPSGATVGGIAVDGRGFATVAAAAGGDLFLLRYGFADSSAGPLSFHTLEPCRAFDSRESGSLSGPSERTIGLAGRCAIPTTAKAISLNATVTQATAPGNIALAPAGQAGGVTSTLNYGAGQTRASNATVKLGADARLLIRVNQGAGALHVLIDVVGFWQ